jgi:hypothetical protein
VTGRPSRGFAFGAVAVVLIGFLALTSRGNHAAVQPPSAVASSPPPSPQRSFPALPTTRPFVKTCADGLQGTLTPETWRHSLFAGPLAVIWLRPSGDLSPGSLGHHFRGYQPAYYLVVVRQGHAVELSVPLSQQAHVAFLYNSPTASPDTPLQVGDTSVTLRACPGLAQGLNNGTQFIGQVLVGHARCVVLNVRDVATDRLWRLTAPLMGHGCPRALTPIRASTTPPGPF